MSKKVSVVIPFFQRERGLLRKAVNSALKQRGEFRMQIVVVDDGSPIPARSELEDLLSIYGDKFVIVEQENAGCFPAGNVALNHVSPDSDYVAFLDSDDEWFDGHISNAVWALNRGYDLYFSDFYQLNKNVTAFNRAKRIAVCQHPRIDPAKPIHEYSGNMVDQVITGNVFGTSTIVYRQKTFQDIRYLEGYKHTGPEYIFWIQLALRSRKIAFSSEPECRYGGGVNIFSESGWGTEKFLSVRHDEIRYRKYLLDTLPLSEGLRNHLKSKIRESRIAFGKGLLHSLRHRTGLNRQMLWNQAVLDPMSYVSFLYAPGVIIGEKIAGLLGRNQKC
jgi:succinoglycan biosynthesis protein ExoW